MTRGQYVARILAACAASFTLLLSGCDDTQGPGGGGGDQEQEQEQEQEEDEGGY